MLIDSHDPHFSSLALQDIDRPDFADVQIIRLPRGGGHDARDWAGRIFEVGNSPAWVVALMRVRQVLVGVIGIPRGDSHAFDVQRLIGEEALITTDDPHLCFCCGVAVDAEQSLLRVTRSVRPSPRSWPNWD